MVGVCASWHFAGGHGTCRSGEWLSLAGRDGYRAAPEACVRQKMKILTFDTGVAPEDTDIFDLTAQTMNRVDYECQQITVGSAKDLKKMMTSAQDVTPVGMPITRPCDVQSDQDEQSGLSGTGTWQLNQKGLPARVVEREIGCEA